MYSFSNGHGPGHVFNGGFGPMPGMPHMHNPYLPAVAPVPQGHRSLQSGDITLEIRQEPKEALVTVAGKEKARKPVDPPPIIQLNVSPQSDPHQHYLQSPYLFMTCSLVGDKDLSPILSEDKTQALTGSLVSSLHRLKDTQNQDGGFFVFGDVSVKKTGTHRLHFSLFDFHKETREVQFLSSITTMAFKVVKQSDFRGLDESTYLSRAFSDQGVRLRLRKEPRAFGGTKRALTYASPTPQGLDYQHGQDYQHGPSHYKHEDEQDSPPQPKRMRSNEDTTYNQNSPLAVRAPPMDYMNSYHSPTPGYSNMQSSSVSRQPDYSLRHHVAPSAYMSMPSTSSVYPEPPSAFSHTSIPNYSIPSGQNYGQRSDLDGYHIDGRRDTAAAASGLANLSVQPAYTGHSHFPPNEHDHDFNYGQQSSSAFASSLTGAAAFDTSLEMLNTRPKSRYEESVAKQVDELKKEQAAEASAELSYDQ